VIEFVESASRLTTKRIEKGAFNMISFTFTSCLLLMSVFALQPEALRPVAASAGAVCPLFQEVEVPEVNVQNLEGETVTLHEAISGRPSVLIFYRGGW